MSSKVSKPLWLNDVGGRWETIPTMFKIREAYSKDPSILSDAALKKLNKIEESWLTEEAKLSRGDNVPYKVWEALDVKHNKDIQKVLKEEGYDHISYINTREGQPIELAIIFDRADVDVK